MTLKKKLSDVVKTVFPATWAEGLIFLFFLSSYGLLAITIALNYRIIFDDRIPWDAYFSFDNRSIVLTGGAYERHPLANYFFEVLRNLAFFFSDCKKNEVFRLVLALCSTLAVSLTMVHIYKYLKNILGLPLYIAGLLLIFFGLFSTNILLSFTPETYTYTLLFLTMFTYYAALKLRQDKPIPAAALTLGGVFIGGLTVTNLVKVYLPVLFEKNIFLRWKAFGYAALRVLVAAGVFVLLFWYRMDFKTFSFFGKSAQQFEKFSAAKETPYWDMASSWFFGGTVLFGGFDLRDYFSKKGYLFKALFMDVYHSPFLYGIIAVLMLLVVWSYVKNFKNKLVQVLMLSFLVDIIIHVILKFGLHTAYIYGGHFVFVYPLLLGWLFRAYRFSPKKMTALFTVLSLITVFMAFNTYFRMSEFFEFLDFHYR